MTLSSMAKNRQGFASNYILSPSFSDVSLNEIQFENTIRL